jgi:mannan endo-1,4-beta-mannosidase
LAIESLSCVVQASQNTNQQIVLPFISVQFNEEAFQMRLITAFLTLTLLTTAAAAQNDMRQFITRSGDKLMEGQQEYRFISFNIPNLHIVEDNMRFEATNEWRFPNEFEIVDALATVKHLGGRVTRIYVLSICRKEGPNPIPCHVKRPGEFNEEAFRALDKVLEVANRIGVRVIIPLVDNWKWWGGIEQYAEYRGKSAAEFWTDRGVIEDFKKTVQFVINRRNTLTGTLYKDDKAILAWETGNELYSPYSWTREIAAQIKSLDSNHLVLDGFYLGNREIQPEALDDPNIDIVSSHHYPGPNKGAAEMAADIARFRQQIVGKKAYIEGELGFIPVAGMERVLDTVIRQGVSGALGWSLRFHNRDGGFYWHSEPAGGGLYKAYHYPGFPSGDAYEERALLKLMRAKAYEIRGMPEPPPEVPSAPALLPISSVAAISWQGSVGASGYDVERSASSEGPWTIVGMNVDDTSVQYRGLFSDSKAETGKSYYYRVHAKNAAGSSAPSNVVGPVRVDVYTTVDELSDSSRVFAHDGSAVLSTANARAYKEDAHRLKGTAGSWITYRTVHPLRYARVLVFMERSEKNLEFLVSRDGNSFSRIDPKVSRFPTEVNPYGYKLPIQYELAEVGPGKHFLKIVFTGDAQISRVELQHRK